MAERYPYDLSHYSFMSGRIGHLMTLSCIPVIAGDSITLSVNGAIRLSPLRRDLVLDAQCDLFAFYIPHRHIYGDNWQIFIQDGVDEQRDLATITLTAPVQYLGYNNVNGVVPRWLVAGYNQIWNRYFRIPNGPQDPVDEANVPTSLTNKIFGYSCARLKTLPVSGTTSRVDSDDYDLHLSDRSVIVGNVATLQLNRLAAQKARLKTEVERGYFGNRYTDLLSRTWDGSASTDADQRPTLLMRTSEWLSGYDVDGTGDANLGQYSGKAAAVVSMDLNRKFFAEHGALWIMALLRFPTIFEKETHYLVRHANPSYKEIAGDPDIVANEIPHRLEMRDMFSDTTSSTFVGYFPYGQWYRYHPSVIHNKYDELTGFPFKPTIPTNHAAALYTSGNDYDDVFATQQLGQWRSQMRINCMANRVVPPPTYSIYAGSR